jgi:hypothetical protein
MKVYVYGVHVVGCVERAYAVVAVDALTPYDTVKRVLKLACVKVSRGNRDVVTSFSELLYQVTADRSVSYDKNPEAH